MSQATHPAPRLSSPFRVRRTAILLALLGLIAAALVVVALTIGLRIVNAHRKQQENRVQNSCTSKRLTRRCPSPEVASCWSGLLLRVAVLPVCGALAVSACARDSGVQQAPPDALEVPVPRGLEDVAHLRRAQSALDNRPASCTTTHAIVISDGTPKPRRLRVGSGACLIWGNMSGGPVRVSYARALGGAPAGTRGRVRVSGAQRPRDGTGRDVDTAGLRADARR